MLPLALRLDDRPVLVVGAGRIGAQKAAQLVAAGARVSVVSEEIKGVLPDGLAHVTERRFRPSDVTGYRLVIAATGDPDVNDVVVAAAESAGVWLNVVDDPERSSFYFMALHRDGDVCLAVTTGGASPALAQEVRSLAAASLPRNLAAVALALRAERRALHVAGASTEGLDWRRRVRELLGVAVERGEWH